MKNTYIAVLIVIFVFIIFFRYMNPFIPKSSRESSMNQKTEIRYIPIGDSYTIGFGVSEEERWPNILINNLRKKGVDIALIENPAVTGYTVRDAIEFELPVIERLKPNFVTVLIGANDSFGFQDIEIFRKDLNELLNRLQSVISNPKRIVLITLPDYSKSPAVINYDTVALLNNIEKYNLVIKEEGGRRGFPVTDIFPVSQTMTHKSDYILDGLHPSGNGYVKWEKTILPVVFGVLKR